MKKLLFAAALLIAIPALLAACGGTPATTATTGATSAPTGTATPTAVINTPGSGATAENGETVTVSYIGTLQDGTVFDSSQKDGKPLTFVLGAGQMISGFDAAVNGMQVGETKTVTLPPNEAYGPYEPNLVITLARSQFPATANLTLGMQVPLQNSSGQTAYGHITKLSASSVTVDLNPPLAGKTLTFQITLEAVSAGPTTTTATPTTGG